MQRTGRKGHAQFRIVVQDSRQSPSSGKTVALVGNYNPHTKSANLVKDKIDFYLKHGAQPSDRTAILLKQEGIKLPDWVNVDTKKQAKIRHAEKLRKNQPKDAKAETKSEPVAVEPEESANPTAETASPTSEETTETQAPNEVPADENSDTKTTEDQSVQEEKPAEVSESNASEDK